MNPHLASTKISDLLSLINNIKCTGFDRMFATNEDLSPRPVSIEAFSWVSYGFRVNSEKIYGFRVHPPLRKIEDVLLSLLNDPIKKLKMLKQISAPFSELMQTEEQEEKSFLTNLFQKGNLVVMNGFENCEKSTQIMKDIFKWSLVGVYSILIVFKKWEYLFSKEFRNLGQLILSTNTVFLK